MNSTLAIFKIAWEDGLAYRLNFVLWRIRTVLQFLLVYFIWWTIFQTQSEIFGYKEQTILTYILLIAVIRAIVLSSRANDIMNKINDGSIANFLLRPIGLIRYYFAQDMADKLLNCFFMVFEITLIILLFKPDIVLQKDFVTLTLFVSAILLGLTAWFFINIIIGLMAFWVENSWGPLFLLMIFMEGLGGGLFPIDILPKQVFDFLMVTPFPYLIYFPAKVYIGGFNNTQLVLYFSIFIFWVLILRLLMKWVLKKGLRYYSSVSS